MSKECDRRTFLTSNLAASTGLGTTASGGIFAKTVASTTEPPTKPIPKRPLGKTGYQVTIYGLGGLFTVLLPYVLSYPVSAAVVGISDVSHLEENVRIASAFEQLSEEEMAEIRALARS